MRKTKRIFYDKRFLIALLGISICVFVMLFILWKWKILNNEKLPVRSIFKNRLETAETIRIKFNETSYLLTLDSNRVKIIELYYRIGVNRIIISLSDSIPLIDDTLVVQTKKLCETGGVSVEIDKPTDKIGLTWGEDSTIYRCSYFYKSIIKEHNNKRIKFALVGYPKQ